MKFRSIKTTLFLSFSVFIVLTLISVVTAWVAFNNLEKNQLNIINATIPSLVDSQQLVVLGSQLSNQTGRLLTAKTAAELTQEWEELENQSNQLQLTLDRPQLASSEFQQNQLNTLFNQLHLNLTSIHGNISHNLTIKQSLFEMKIRLEWLKNDIFDELNPLVADLYFNLQSGAKSNHNENPYITRQINQLTLFNNLKSQINLINDIVVRTVDSQNDENVKTSELYIGQLIGQIKAIIPQLSDTSTLVTLKQSIDDLFKLIEGPDSVFLKTKIQLELLKNSQNLVTLNQQLLTQLNSKTKQQALVQQQQTLQQSQHIFKQTQQSQWSLLIIFIISVSLAVAIGWFYVKRSLVFRISHLNENMISIANGNMNTQITSEGKDEICSMANSLSRFRDTLVETQNELVQAGKLAALGQLSAGVAHELNQPLAAIRNYSHSSKVLIQRGQGDKALEAINNIDKLSETMAKIITQFKEFSRKSSHNIQAIRLNEVINNVLTLLEGELDKNAIELQLPPLIGDITVYAEMIRLEQVLVNLFSNAIHAMKTSKIKTLSLSTQVNDAKTHLLLHIKDTGSGIKEEHKEHIFEPFFSTKESKGLGLGLSISYNIMKDFKGALELNKTLRKGCEFILHIPIKSNLK